MKKKTIEERITRLEVIRSELFDLANSFAGEPHGWAASTLHSACGRIHRAITIVKEGATTKNKLAVLQEHIDNDAYTSDITPELLLAILEKES